MKNYDELNKINYNPNWPYTPDQDPANIGHQDVPLQRTQTVP